MEARRDRLGTRRSAVVWTLVGLATLLLLVSSLTVWAKRQLLDTEAWTNSASRLLANDEVRSALAVKLTDAVNQRVDMTEAVRERLPEAAKPAAPVIAAGLQNASGRAIETFLATPTAQRLWEEANRKAHATLVNVLEGKPVGPLETVDGNVVIDLKPVVGKVADRIGVGDRLREGVENRGPGAGQITLLESSQLGTAQAVVKTLRHVSIALLLLVLALYALAVYLARTRRRIVLESVGACLIGVGLVVLVVRRIVGSYLLDSLVTTDAARPAADAAWLIGTDLLRDIAVALIAYGLLVLLAGILAGHSRPATWIRRQLAPAFAKGPWVVHAAGLAVFLIVIAWGPTTASRRLFGVLLLGALFFSGLEVWRRQTIREFAADPAAGEPVSDEAPAAPVLGA